MLASPLGYSASSLAKAAVPMEILKQPGGPVSGHIRPKKVLLLVRVRAVQAIFDYLAAMLEVLRYMFDSRCPKSWCQARPADLGETSRESVTAKHSGIIT